MEFTIITDNPSPTTRKAWRPPPRARWPGTPRVLVGWPLPLGFGLDGRLLLVACVGGFMFNSSSSSQRERRGGFSTQPVRLFIYLQGALGLDV